LAQLACQVLDVGRKFTQLDLPIVVRVAVHESIEQGVVEDTVIPKPAPARAAIAQISS
jgi:hypothetical protein